MDPVFPFHVFCICFLQTWSHAEFNRWRKRVHEQLCYTAATGAVIEVWEHRGGVMKSSRPEGATRRSQRLRFGLSLEEGVSAGDGIGRVESGESWRVCVKKFGAFEET